MLDSGKKTPEPPGSGQVGPEPEKFEVTIDVKTSGERKRCQFGFVTYKMNIRDEFELAKAFDCL